MIHFCLLVYGEDGKWFKTLHVWGGTVEDTLPDVKNIFDLYPSSAITKIEIASATTGLIRLYTQADYQSNRITLDNNHK